MPKAKKHHTLQPLQRRMHVIGQCNGSDFEHFDHLVLESRKPDFVLDTEHIKKKHVLAFTFLKMCFNKGIPHKLTKEVVQEVLFWGYEDERSEKIEIRIVRDEKLVPKIALFKGLWYAKESSKVFSLPKRDTDDVMEDFERTMSREELEELQ